MSDFAKDTNVPSTDNVPDTNVGDMIYRQAAIDSIHAWVEMNKYYHPYSNGRTIPVDEAVDELSRVPSAQPQWIPCSERLPEIRQEVLLCDGLWYFIAEYCGAFWYIDGVFKNSEDLDYDGFAWMPLPKPYGGEQDGQTD